MAEKRDQRRLAAILVADVVGYSRLMEADEVGTLAALRERRKTILEPVVKQHGGRIVKVMGDGVLVEVASAVNSVKAAIELQNLFSKANEGLPQDRCIDLRIGINLGDVIGEGADIYGEGVNIAARLEGLAEPGGISVSAKVRDEVQGKIDAAFEDAGHQKLKNTAQPVRVYRVMTGSAPSARTEQSSRMPQLPDRTTVAVLPFTNMSADPDQEYFADGLTEDLITDLSKVPGLFVIARNSSFTYKGKAPDIRSVATDLGVRYVIEGSVRRASARVRINAQLIDATTNSHVWADRFDRDLADVFQLQDEVVGRIVSAFSGIVPSARPITSKRAKNIEAYDLFIRGRVMALQSPDGNKAALPLLKRSIEIDPNFAEAHSWLAMAYHFGWLYWGHAIERHRSLARDAARRAVLLDPDSADAHMILGYVRAYDDELENGIVELRKALSLNPNHADSWALLTDLMVLEGQHSEAIACVQNAFRLNPHPRGVYYWVHGFALYAAGRYEEAIDTLREDPARGTGSQRLLAASLAQLGRLAEAQDEVRSYLAAIPHFSVRHWSSTQHFKKEEDRQHFIDGYIKAGLPM